MQPQIGDQIEVNGHQHEIKPCDDWDKAQFRIPVKWFDVAVNIKITGKKIYRVGGYAEKTRCKIEFVGDVGEDDHIEHGWLIRYR
jgi:hypothetical protein